MGRLQDDGREDERDGMSTRTMHWAMNGMGRLDVGWEDERDGMSNRTMYGTMNGMERKLGGYG
jgi:hypothetical protein